MFKFFWRFFLLSVLLFWLGGSYQEAYGQNYGKPSAKTERLKRQKKKEKKRKRNRDKIKVSRKRAKFLQKSYYKKRSKLTQKYAGTTQLQPKRRDYNAIKERVERNPSRQNLQSRNKRKSVYRRKSRGIQKGYGGRPVLSPNKKLAYKYGARTSGQFKGRFKRNKSKKDYRRQSRQMQNYSGSIFVQPRAQRRDYTEIRSRVDKNPGRSRMKSLKQQQAKFRSTAAKTQKYSGNIIRNPNYQKYNAKYRSKAMHLSEGQIKSKTINARSNLRKRKSNQYANFQGGYKAISQRTRSQLLEGKSLNVSSFAGDRRAMSRNQKRKWNKKYSSTVAQYQGGIKSYGSRARRQQLEGKSKNLSSYQGNRRGNTQNQKDKWGKYASKYTLKHSGNIKGYTQKQKDQMLQGKSMNLTFYSGNINANKFNRSRQKRRSSTTKATQYTGSIQLFKPRDREKMYEYLSIVQHNDRGLINAKKSSRAREQRRKASHKAAINTGNLPQISNKRQKHGWEYLSDLMHQYQGEINSKKSTRSMGNRRKSTHEAATFSGNLPQISKKRRDYGWEYLSGLMHQYQGELRQKDRQRSIDKRRELNERMGRYQGEIRYNAKTKERNFEYMSKTAHNYQGEKKVLTQRGKKRYYQEISSRNLTISGDYKLKYPWYRDLGHQITSARVHNYQGGPKKSWFARMWMKITNNEEGLKKTEYRLKEPKYDSREAEIWY